MLAGLNSCSPSHRLFVPNCHALLKASLKLQVERSTVRPSGELGFTHIHIFMYTFVHIPVQTLRPNLFGFPQRNTAHLLEPGSVTQGIGNVLWLEPLAPSWL